MIKVAPSILSANFANLHGDLKHIPNADMLHIDVMDGHFVPNITVGIPVIKALKKETKMFLDVHLMIEKPRLLMEEFCATEPDSITIHVESDTVKGTEEAFEIMKKHGVLRGLAIRPSTKASAVMPFIKYLDMVLVMTVEPGFGGQAFMESQLQTIKQINELRQRYNRDMLIQVDGGINEKTAVKVKEAGANVLVAGAAVFGDPHPKKAIEAIRDAE